MNSRLQLILSSFDSIWILLPNNYKKKAYIVLILIFIAALFEALGIGMIVPVMVTITDPDIMSRDNQLINYLISMGIDSHRMLIIFVISSMILIYFLKNLFLAWLAFFQARYVYDIKGLLTNFLFKKYIYNNYEFHISRNSNDLQRNVFREPTVLAQNVINPILILSTEIIVILTIALLLLILQPGGSVFAFFCFLIAMIFFQNISKRYTSAWGIIRLNAETSTVRNISDSLGGIKQVKMATAENFFAKVTKKYIDKLASVEALFQGIAASPRLWLETIGIITIFSWAIFLMETGSSSEELLAAIGIFAAAAFRILPSANKILVSFQAVSYGQPALKMLNDELKDYKEINNSSLDNKKFNFKNIISFDNVSFRYSSEQENTINDISFKIKKGQSIGITGESGSGKTTIIDLLLGLIEPSSGKVIIDGTNLNSIKNEWKSVIGYVQQDIYLTDDTLKKNIAFGVEESDISDEKVLKSMEAASLSSFLSSLPDGIDTPMGERGVRLSGGQKQRIGIARALYSNPSIIVFDEATSALDYSTENKIMNVLHELKSQGKTLILIAHRLSTLEFCDAIYVLDKNGIHLK